MNMKLCKQCGKEKPIGSYYKNRSKCKDCVCSRMKEYRLKDSDNIRVKDRLRYEQKCLENPEQVKLVGKEYRNRPEIKIRNKLYSKEYIEKNKEHLSLYKKQYRDENRDSILFNRKKPENRAMDYFHMALRRAAKLQATPGWANKEAIKSIYKQREEISKSTGIVHHVDHIIPLRGKYVSGLHVENNLQIIPAKENLSKNNKHFDE